MLIEPVLRLGAVVALGTFERLLARVELHMRPEDRLVLELASTGRTLQVRDQKLSHRAVASSAAENKTDVTPMSPSLLYAYQKSSPSWKCHS